MFIIVSSNLLVIGYVSYIQKKKVKRIRIIGNHEGLPD